MARANQPTIKADATSPDARTTPGAKVEAPGRSRPQLDLDPHRRGEPGVASAFEAVAEGAEVGPGVDGPVGPAVHLDRDGLREVDERGVEPEGELVLLVGLDPEAIALG